MSMSSCGSQLPGSGLFEGEEILAVVRIVTTLVSFTVTSAWFSGEKIARLSLFFAHWLSGLVAGLCSIVADTMVTLCWTGSNAATFMKILRFVELAASNMFAVTNLAICVNLALVVSSHRTMSRVRSVSSPRLLLIFLAISIVLAAPIIPLTESIFVTAAGFFLLSSDKRDNDIITTSFFYVEFFVGICMSIIVAWLLLFRLKEIKECWRIHARIRFYFLLTLVGIAVNLGLGVSGMINVLVKDFIFLLLSWSWAFRYIHYALDTVVLYGVLRERNMDERGDNNITGSGSGGSSLPSSGRRAPCDGSMARGSRRSNDTSKPVSFTPSV